MSLVRCLCASSLVLATSLALVAPARAATVVASRGPSAAQYPVGRKLDAGAQLNLAAGDTVTLLDNRGTRVLSGPGNFPVVQAAASNRQSVFAALVRDRTSVRVRTGSVRNGPNGEPPRSPNLWYVDVSRPGAYCLADPDNVRLWRPAPGTNAEIAVKGPGGSGKVSFGKDDLVAPWDAAAGAISPGTTYELSDGEGKPLGWISFELVGGDTSTMEGLAAKLIEKKCTVQLDLLASSLQLPTGG